jgi:hypothetical protein
MGRGTDRAVYVIEGGFAKRRVVDVGISTWEGVEVRSGVAEGDRVIVSLSNPKLAEGVSVVGEEEVAKGNR